MIFGKTSAQKDKEYQTYLKNFTFKIKFAWFPIELDDGRKVWLQYYKYKPLIWDKYGYYYSNSKIIYRWV